MDHVPVYILAGGKSSRFGSDKARALLGGEPLISRVACMLRPCAERVTVIADAAEKFEDLGLPTLADAVPGLGPLGGLKTALADCAADWLLLVSCDMAALNPMWVQVLLEKRAPNAQAVLFQGKHLEPLFALYHASIAPFVESRIQSGERALWRLIESLQAVILPLPPDWPALAHVNTPEELADCAAEQLRDSGRGRPPHPPKPLAGKTIAVPETREIELFAGMLQEQGAAIVRCPLIGILDAPAAPPVEAWLRALAGGEMQDLVLFTGEGLRRLLGFARRSGCENEFRAALARVRKITRGPKPAKALAELGLKTDFPSVAPTTEGVIETLGRFDLRGRVVGVQLYGGNPNQPLMDWLRSAGAAARPVAPYVYAPRAHDEQVVALIRRLAAGEIDALAFTAGAQVKRLREAAEKFHLEAELAAGLARTKVAAVGPVVARELSNQGIKLDIVPKSSFILRQLVAAIVEHLRG